jgi:hypothetical protein
MSIGMTNQSMLSKDLKNYSRVVIKSRNPKVELDNSTLSVCCSRILIGGLVQHQIASCNGISFILLN